MNIDSTGMTDLAEPVSLLYILHLAFSEVNSATVEELCTLDRLSAVALQPELRSAVILSLHEGISIEVSSGL